MRSALVRGAWLSLVLLLSLPAVGVAEAPPGAPEAAAAPVAPDGSQPAPAPERAPTLPELEREAADRVAGRFARRIAELEALAREVKGMELREVQRQLEAAKRTQAEEEIRARIEVAREAGDEVRARQLERVLQPAVPSPARPELRPLPEAGKAGGR